MVGPAAINPCPGEELVIENRLDELSRLEGWLSSVAGCARWSSRTRFALDMVLNEALTNVINHGFDRPGGHRIAVCLEERAAELLVSIRDDGRPFDPLRYARLPSVSDLGEVPVGGRGILLIKRYTQGGEYRRVAGYNELRLAVYKQEAKSCGVREGGRSTGGK